MYTTLEHFLKYITYDTQSDESARKAGKIPSTPGQWELAREMERELNQRGLVNVSVSEYCYVTGTLPANTDRQIKIPAIGFIAHLDTATEASGKNVKARVVRNYDGGNITLNEALNVVMSPEDFPFMKNYIGHDLVVTDGTTLLGADDKAGIAEIIGAVDWMIAHPEFEHGDVKIAFTPDEEIGELASHLDIEAFGADFAYTIDGDELGEISYENFNAAGATLKIHGRSVHPGSAKGLMLSAVTMGCEFLSMLPPSETPATTEKREGYYHCLTFNGDTENAELHFLIRDHDMKKFEARKKFFADCVDWMRHKYGAERFDLEMHDQYYNMREKLDGNMHIVDLAVKAMKALGIEPYFKAMRGGTDGAALSYRGLITPNIFIGGHNYHGCFEFVSVQVMEKATEVILKILELAAK